MSGTSAECLCELIQAFEILEKWQGWAHLSHRTLDDVLSTIILLDPNYKSQAMKALEEAPDVLSP